MMPSAGQQPKSLEVRRYVPASALAEKFRGGSETPEAGNLEWKGGALLGRVVGAAVASLVLKLPVYDTQCGAKVFRVDDNFRAALAEPFSSRWAFDVELLLRITRGPDPVTSEQLLEVPLKKWEDLGGSKLTATAMLRAGLDLLALASRDDA